MGNELTHPNNLNREVISIFAKGDNSYGSIDNLNTKELNLKKLFMDNYCQYYGIDSNNNLISWGLNNYYQLANGKKSNYLFNSEKVEAKKKIEDHFSVISVTNKNLLKKLGKIFYSKIEFPIAVPKIKNISCGDGFTLFLDTSGQVFSVGKNDKGQLGYELENNKSEFVNGIKCNSKVTLIEFFTKNNIHIDNIFCGSDFAFAINIIKKNNNDINDDFFEEVYSWGNNEKHQLGTDDQKYKYYFTPIKSTLINKIINFSNEIEKIVCGWCHTCILTSKGEIYIWGNPFKDYDKKFKDIEIPKNINFLGNFCKIIQISSGFHHIAILAKDLDETNHLYTLGANEFCQLGYETKEIYSFKFKEVIFPKNEFIDNINIIQVECGAYHTIVRFLGDIIYGFGQNNCGQVGKYGDECIKIPKKWNYDFENFFKDKITDQKILVGMKCSNGITCMFFKNKTQICTEKNDEEEKNIFTSIISTEDYPLKTSHL